MKKRLSIIGAGKLGRTLGKLWNQAGEFEIAGVINHSEASAKKSVDYIGSGTVITELADLPESDILLIATKDGDIQRIAENLSQSISWLNGCIVWHASGMLNSGILDSVRSKGAVIASAHPAKSFTGNERDGNDLARIFIALEGNSDACDVLTSAFLKLKASPFQISPEKKVLYHAGTVFASNFITALVHGAETLCREAGVSQETARALIDSLGTGSLHNATALGPRKALTGPVQRGDLVSLQAHMSAIEEYLPNLASSYRELSKLALSLTDVPENISRNILEILKEPLCKK